MVAAWVNSKAHEIAGITRNTPNPAGGRIIRNAQGEPTEILTTILGGKVVYQRED